MASVLVLYTRCAAITSVGPLQKDVLKQKQNKPSKEESGFVLHPENPILSTTRDLGINESIFIE